MSLALTPVTPWGDGVNASFSPKMGNDGERLNGAIIGLSLLVFICVPRHKVSTRFRGNLDQCKFFLSSYFITSA